MKKLAVIGRGTAGSLAVPHFLNWTDWEIDWYFDPNIKPQAVGEGTTTLLPFELSKNLDFGVEELENIYGTYKGGIKKTNWGTAKTTFYHPFFNGSVGYHFNAVKLQEFIFNKLNKNPRIRFIDKNVDLNSIDSDHILDCSGAKNLEKDFVISDFIPVNSAYVTQCFWSGPKFIYTLCIARPYGWIFGIPLLNRCSIGYLFNRHINNIDEIKDDVQIVFKELDLIPSQETNLLSFNNYYRKKNFDGRICYNGNASFFLEPLEATSIHFMSVVNRLAFSRWKEDYPEQLCNNNYLKFIKEIENVIMLHYAAGSKFKTKFWELAENKGIENFKSFLSAVNINHFLDNPQSEVNIGSWSNNSFVINLLGLGLVEQIEKGKFN